MFDTIELDPKWLLNVGLRYDTFDTEANTNAVPTATVKPRSKIKDDSQFFNWQAGLVWKPVENASIYASYATSASPAGGLVGEGADANPLSAGAASSDLQPEETVNYELGTKWDLFHDRLSLTAAVFRTEKKNTRILVDALTYQNAGESQVDGIELSASGKLTDHWQVFAGYSYLDSELVKAGRNGRNGVISAGSNEGNQMPNTPKNSFSLWTTYDVTAKLTVGGGAFYVDDVYGDVGKHRLRAVVHPLRRHGQLQADQERRPATERAKPDRQGLLRQGLRLALRQPGGWAYGIVDHQLPLLNRRDTQQQPHASDARGFFM